MKSFKNFLEEQQGRKEFLETHPKTEAELNAQRRRLANIPVLSDDEMRAQNPGATAAYEKDAAERKGRKRTVTVDTPEGQITASGTSKSGKIPIQTSSGKTIYVTPDEAIARAEAGLNPPVKNKPKKVVSRSNASTQSTPTPAPAKPKPAETQNISLNRQPAPKPNVGSPLTVSSPKPAAPTPTPPKPAAVKPALVGASTNNPAKELEKVSGKIIRQMRADRTAAAVKAVRNLGRASTVLGTTLDFQSAFQKAKQSDAGQRRAIGAGIAAAGGGLAGAATGARIGGLVGGLPGSIVGGVLGYTGGVKKAGQIYRGVVGKPGEQVTSQSVLKNIKKVYRQEVPTSIRRVVPQQVKKGFTDFYNQAVGAAKNLKKSYDAYNATQK